MLKSIDRPSITPSESSSTTTKDVDVKVDQKSKAIGVAKATDSPHDKLEKQDVNETSVIESKDHGVGDQDCSKKGRNLDTRWEIMLARLLAFKEKHGDCLVPNRYPDDTQLGSWGKKRCRLVCILFGGVDAGVVVTAEFGSDLLTKIYPPLLQP
jgi:hypothetical protein